MKLLLLVTSILLVANVAMADHIGIYSDATGSSCVLAPGFSTTATLIHRFSAGSDASLFIVSATNAPGSSIFGINSPYQTLCINPPCPFSYGGCYQTLVLGTIIANLGTTGYIEVVGVNNALPAVLDCNQGEHTATGGRGYLGVSTGDCSPPVPVEGSTWGAVKSLYR